jgi:hypothetical protein
MTAKMNKRKDEGGNYKKMGKSILMVLTAALIVAGFSVSESVAFQGEGKPHRKMSPYVGSEVCGTCHKKTFDSWEKTRLARALIVLGPRKAMKVKKKMGLDPYIDYTKDPDCLKCHTTGFEMNKDGSYSFVEYGIGCEVCHGPGKKYSEIMKKRGKVYKRAELVAAGLNLDFETICLTCHNEESPLVDRDYIFSDQERYKGVHDKVKLKYHEKIKRFVDEDENQGNK